MLKSILAVVGMICVGLLVWRLLERQGHGSPPHDLPEDAPRPSGPDPEGGPKGNDP